MVFGGGAFGKGLINMARTGGWFRKLGADFIGEFLEESSAEIVDYILMRSIVNRNVEPPSVQDVLYAGLIGWGLAGAGMGAVRVAGNKTRCHRDRYGIRKTFIVSVSRSNERLR